MPSTWRAYRHAPSVTEKRWWRSISDAGGSAAAFHEDDVTPHAGEAADALANAQHAKTALLMEAQARMILPKNAGLQGPYAGCLRGSDQFAQESGADACAA